MIPKAGGRARVLESKSYRLQAELVEDLIIDRDHRLAWVGRTNNNNSSNNSNRFSTVSRDRPFKSRSCKTHLRTEGRSHSSQLEEAILIRLLIWSHLTQY
jgi:hypothetical protein